MQEWTKPFWTWKAKGMWFAFNPDFPGVMSYGSTRLAAMVNLVAAADKMKA